MQALDTTASPSAWRSYAGMLWCHRPGLPDPLAMPCIERNLNETTVNARWLENYRACIGLAPDADSALPPLTLQIAAAPLHLAILADRKFPFKALGLVHVAQSVLQTEPMPPNQSFALRAYTSTAEHTRRGTHFGLVTEALVDGRIVWRSETTALAKESVLHPDGVQPKQEERPLHSAAADTGWNHLMTTDIPEPLGRRYAAIAGDLNPIHQHALLARPFGLPRAIIHGTWTLARGLAAAMLPNTSHYALTAQFRKPVFLPSTIVISGRTNDLEEELRITDQRETTTYVSAQVRR